MFETTLIDHTVIFWISAIGVLLQISVILYEVVYKPSDLQLSGTPIALAIVSWNLKIVHIASLATCIPIGLDVLLDMFSKEKTIDWAYRPLFLFAIALPSVVYTYCDDSLTPVIYLSVYNFGFIAFDAAISSMLIRVHYSKTKAIHLILSHLFFVVCSFLKVVSVVFYVSWIDTARSVALMGVTMNVFITVYYGFKTIQLSTNHFNFHDSKYKWLNISGDELIFSLYILLFMLLTGFIQHARFSGGLISFRHLTSDYFIKVQIYFMFFGSFVTILPGRLARIKVELCQQMITTKGHFVRYVSHEIRSPLFVVSAGLEMTINELEATSAVPQTLVDLVSDVFDSTTSAINLLNDLLQYENMELDSFKLDVSWRGLSNLFGLKVSTLTALAKKSDVQFLIDDPLNLFGNEKHIDYVKAMLSRSEIVGSDDFFSSVDYSEVVLRVDRYRVDQIIRNLIVNAIKFTPKGGSVFVRTSISARRNESNTSSKGVIPSSTGNNQQEDVFSTNYFKSTTKSLSAKLYRPLIEFEKLEPIGDVMVEVIDSGVGIAIENQSKVFGEFTQFDRNKLQAGGGSGLGLWISRRIAEYHQGKVDFHSAGEGKGSTFFVTLPVYIPPQGFALKMSSEPTPSLQSRSPNKLSKRSNQNHTSTSSNTILNSKIKRTRRRTSKTTSLMATVVSTEADEAKIKVEHRFLIVDDSSTNLKMMRRLLESAKDHFPGCVIDEADDGDVAVEMVSKSLKAETPYGAVLMDSMMDRMHGTQATVLMRNDVGYKGLIIGVTGNAREDEIQAYKDCGVDEVLTKPITRAKLIDTISALRDEKM